MQESGSSGHLLEGEEFAYCLQSGDKRENCGRRRLPPSATPTILLSQ